MLCQTFLPVSLNSGRRFWKIFSRSLFGILRRTNYFHFLPYMFENYCFFFKTGFKFIPEFRLIGIKGLEKLRYFLSKRMRVSLESVKITFIIFYSSSLCYFSIPKVLSRCVPRLSKIFGIFGTHKLISFTKNYDFQMILSNIFKLL